MNKALIIEVIKYILMYSCSELLHCSDNTATTATSRQLQQLLLPGSSQPDCTFAGHHLWFHTSVPSDDHRKCFFLKKMNMSPFAALKLSLNPHPSPAFIFPPPPVRSAEGRHAGLYIKRTTAPGPVGFVEAASM